MYESDWPKSNEYNAILYRSEQKKVMRNQLDLIAWIL